MKKVNAMYTGKWLGWPTALLCIGLGLGMSARAVAEASPQTMSLTAPNMSQAVMVKNVLNNVTTPPQVKKLTVPTPKTAVASTTTVKSSGVKSEPVGRVVWVKGQFTASLKNAEAIEAPRSLAKASIIYLHDMLETGNASEAQIVFSDNTLMTFRPESKFYIDEYEYNPNAKTKSVGKYIMNLIEGGFRTITGLIAKANPSDYQVNTPVATIGVRGTDYTLVIKNDGIYLARNKGEPCVSNEEKNLCLNVDHKYAQVETKGAAPAYLASAPAFLTTEIVIEHVSYTGAGGAPAAGANGASGSSGESSTESIPVVSTPSSGSGGSGASDFCIR